MLRVLIFVFIVFSVLISESDSEHSLNTIGKEAPSKHDFILRYGKNGLIRTKRETTHTVKYNRCFLAMHYPMIYVLTNV